MGCGGSTLKPPSGYPEISVKEAVNGDMDVMDIVEESKNYLHTRCLKKKCDQGYGGHLGQIFWHISTLHMHDSMGKIRKKQFSAKKMSWSKGGTLGKFWNFYDFFQFHFEATYRLRGVHLVYKSALGIFIRPLENVIFSN